MPEAGAAGIAPMSRQGADVSAGAKPAPAVWVTGLPKGSQAGGAANPSSHAGLLTVVLGMRLRRRSHNTSPATSNSRLASGRAA